MDTYWTNEKNWRPILNGAYINGWNYKELSMDLGYRLSLSLNKKCKISQWERDGTKVSREVSQILTERFQDELEKDNQLLLWQLVHKLTVLNAQKTALIMNKVVVPSYNALIHLLEPHEYVYILENMKSEYVGKYFNSSWTYRIQEGSQILSWDIGMTFIFCLLLSDATGWISVINIFNGTRLENWTFHSLNRIGNKKYEIILRRGNDLFVFDMKRKSRKVDHDGHVFVSGCLYLQVLQKPKRVNSKIFYGDERNTYSTPYPVVDWNDAIILISKVRDILLEVEHPIGKSSPRKRIRNENRHKSTLPITVIQLCLSYLFHLNLQDRRFFEH